MGTIQGLKARVMLGYAAFSKGFANSSIRRLKSSDSEHLRTEIQEGKISRVLLIRDDRLGDAVLSLNFMKAISSKFPDVKVLASELNKGVISKEGLGAFVEPPDWFHKKKSSSVLFFHIFNILEFFTFPFKSLLRLGKPPEYDLIVDLKGDPFVQARHPARYIVGPNKGFTSIYYSCFIDDGFSYPKKGLVELYKEMSEKCLGLNLEIADAPAGLKTSKKNCIFVFVGCAKERQLPYETWKGIVLAASAYAPCVVADDPAQAVMEKMKADPEILGQKKIELIGRKRELDELANLANDSLLFIGIEGGGTHYFERYTNSIVIFGASNPYVWRPYSRNPYVSRNAPESNVLNRTRNSAGLVKTALYAKLPCRPCTSLNCKDRVCVSSISAKAVDFAIKDSKLFSEESKRK